ncbi:hypothetical protein Tco_1129410 [Tanacetum coccineum]
MDGFDKMVEETWKNMVIVDNNDLIRLKKLQFLKQKLQTWTNNVKTERNLEKVKIQNKLIEIDRLLDHGGTNSEVLNQRMELMKSLDEFNSFEAMKVAQKAKLRWSIKGDENTKYFHGVLNDKRSQLAIRGVLVDGEWVAEPVKVKRTFFSHFANRFDKHDTFRLHLDSQFPKVLSIDQVEDLERQVTIEEIKRAVCDCGENKSPGPDGFTFYHLFGGFDSVRWDYLDDILRKFGFGDRWCMWIKGCLNSSMGSVIVNGSPTSEFQFFKVFVGEWKKSNLITIINVLKCFFLASGLKINMQKSKLIGIGVGIGEVDRAANIVGCSTLTSHFSYLRVTLGGSMSRIQTWDEVVRKISSRLSKWKLKTLSIGGRLTLLKSVLGSILLYHMSIFKVPMGVLKVMRSIIRQFFNGADEKGRKMGWICWNKVLISKKKGGLRGGVEGEQYHELGSQLASLVLAQTRDRYASYEMGQEKVESLAHLLFSCSMARVVLSKFASEECARRRFLCDVVDDLEISEPIDFWLDQT